MKTFDELFDKADHMIKTFVQQGGADEKAPIIYPLGRYGMLVKHILSPVPMTACCWTVMCVL